MAKPESESESESVPDLFIIITGLFLLVIVCFGLYYLYHFFSEIIIGIIEWRNWRFNEK